MEMQFHESIIANWRGNVCKETGQEYEQRFYNKN
jgi:hypothetical protein